MPVPDAGLLMAGYIQGKLQRLLVTQPLLECILPPYRKNKRISADTVAVITRKALRANA
jgi:hypothetical protein